MLLRMSAVLRNHFDDSASDDDTVAFFRHSGSLLRGGDAEAFFAKINFFQNFTIFWKYVPALPAAK
mgnify:FL=1